MLEKEFKYFIDNQKELVAKYSGKFLVIIGNEVVGVYDSEKQAYFESINQFEEGTFLIQHCEKGEGAYTQLFHSRVAFDV